MGGVQFTNATPRETQLLSYLMQKNVKYIQGIPEKPFDVEKVYVIELISPMVSSTLASGVKATSTSLDPTVRLDNWSSRWAAVFKQYCVLSCKVFTYTQGTNGGAPANGSWFFRIEEDSTSPTSAIVRSERAQINLHAPSDDKESSCVCVWEPTSSEELEFVSTGTGFAMAYFKSYADPTNTGTSASDSSSQVATYLVYRIAFRYFG